MQAHLEHSSEEGSWVGKASQPVADGVAFVYPAPQLVQALQEVTSPGSQCLQTRVSLQPRWRHLHQMALFNKGADTLMVALHQVSNKPLLKVATRGNPVQEGHPG